ncbi:LLM class flavin-dependent oxidoreductase [Kitasatospora sp. LaBMicrA B282]|uniref:LLM class flavin-dependent oxidoreductase n=1 Tax=Kitasatospora sp. LaBMicrA B282 TaxID=3420949 RepID=UPI003D1312CB
MQHGLLLPNVGYYADPSRLVEFAVRAEEAGWDGVFLWDHLMMSRELRLPAVDAWTVVTGILTRTSRLRSGPLVTPLARRRPWKVARETVTLDHLSEGRLVLGVGLGADADLDFAAFGEAGGLRTRASKVDEALQVIASLWRGSEFSHTGEHYRVDRATFLPEPRSTSGRGEPGVPIWAAATWPASRPGALLRAARQDGIVPMVRGHGGHLRGPDAVELADILARLATLAPQEASVRTRDVVAIDSVTPGDGAAHERSAALAEVGATWRLEAFDPWRRSPKELTAWLDHGPPRLTARFVHAQ